VKAVVRLTPKLRRGVVSMEHGFGSTRYDPLGEPERVGVSGNHLVSKRDLELFSAMPRFNDTRSGSKV